MFEINIRQTELKRVTQRITETGVKMLCNVITMGGDHVYIDVE